MVVVGSAVLTSPEWPLLSPNWPPAFALLSPALASSPHAAWLLSLPLLLSLVLVFSPQVLPELFLSLLSASLGCCQAPPFVGTLSPVALSSPVGAFGPFVVFPPQSLNWDFVLRV